MVRPQVKDAQNRVPERRKSHFGTAGLGILILAIIVAVLRSDSVRSSGREMSSLIGPLEGFIYGVVACSVALILSLVGLLREEQPRWPGILAFALSVIPGTIGFFILVITLFKLIGQIGT